MNFDYKRKYYRVIKSASESGADLLEKALVEGSGLIKDDDPVFEFDTLEKIGELLFLGDRIRSLKIPEDARVVINETDDNGYSFRTDRAELLENYGYEEIIDEIKKTGCTEKISLNIADHKFSRDFVFPEKLDSLVINCCHIPSMVKYPQKVNTYFADNCSFNRSTVIPPGKIRDISLNGIDIYECDFSSASGGFVTVSNASIVEMMFTGDVESISIKDSELKKVYFAERTESIVLTNTVLEKVTFPETVGYLFLIKCRIGEGVKLPKKTGSFRVLDCNYASEEIRERIEKLKD